MPQNPREGTPTHYLDEPPISLVIPLKLPGAPEPHTWAIAGDQDEAVFAEALRRCGGPDAVIRHLISMNVRALIGPEALRHDAYLRLEDIRRIDEAVRHDASSEVLALLLAQAVAFAWIHGKYFDRAFRTMTLNSTVTHLKGKTRKYRKGPDARKAKAAALQEAIRQVLAGGAPRKPRTILEALERSEETSYLVLKKSGKRLSPKTIAHHLAKL
jgi:hypothetical protein